MCEWWWTESQMIKPVSQDGGTPALVANGSKRILSLNAFAATDASPSDWRHIPLALIAPDRLR
jgi:hypothetical protein